MNQITPQPRPTSATSPMQPADVPAVARLFFKAFRKPGSQPPADFVPYFTESFFGAPSYHPALGGMVHRNAQGDIDSALAAIPMPVVVNGETLIGRLMTNYMTDPAQRTSGGAEMVLTLRARQQDFCFSDSATALSAEHWKAVGGMVLPIQSLDWRVVFRPGGWYLRRLQQKLPRSLRAMAGVLGAPLQSLSNSLSMPPGIRVQPMSRDDFIAAAPGFVERFAVHPGWSRPELAWVLGMAEANRVNGPLRICAVENTDGVVLGCFLHYGENGAIAEVLNILCRRGAEASVVAAMLAHLHAIGCAGATGMAQPFLMHAMGNIPKLTYRPRGFFCISTRHAAIKDAATRGDIYVGGLMGEAWSRLISDFWS